MKKSLFILFLTLIAYTALAQTCKVQAFSSPLKNYCGFPFNPFAKADAGEYTAVFQNDFNNKTLGNGWSVTSNVNFENPCGINDGTPYAWMGNGSNTNRTIATNGFDLSAGGRVCFDLKLAETNGTDMAAPDCEAPDLKNEGVYLDYSTDGGVTWNTIFYFDPTPFPRTEYTQWDNYCFVLPEEALTANTRIRWHQLESSGATVDHWGIDNVKIETNPKEYEFIWDHTNDKTANPGPHTPPSSPFTYHVVYKHKITGKQCEASVVVETVMPNVVASANPLTICEGGSSELLAEYRFDNQLLNCTKEQKGCMGKAQSLLIGTGNNSNTNVFGNNGIKSNKTQWMITPSEIGAKCQIASFNLKLNITGGKAEDYFNFSVKIGCSNKADFSDNRFASGLTTVINSSAFRLKNGWNTFDFDAPYNWDGTSNLIIEICWANPIEGANISVESTNTANRSLIYFGTNAYNTANCSRPDGTAPNTALRPNTQLNTCIYEQPFFLKYEWTPSNTLVNATTSKPTARPTNTTSYTVKITDQQNPHCFAQNSITLSTKKPTSGKDTLVTLCKTKGNIDLFTYLTGISDKTGIWRTPSGTITTSTINTNTAATGIYTYNLSDPVCGNLSTKLTLVLENPPNAGINGETTVCINSTSLNLFSFLGGNPQSGGTWTDNNATGALTNGIFNASKYNKTGAVNFTYTIGATANCAAQTALVKVNISPLPNAGTNSSTIVCNTGGSINIFTRLNGNPEAGGSWENNNNAGVITGNTLNLNGVAPGTYKYTYTLPGNAFCPGAKAVLTLTLVDLPNAGENNTISICNANGSLNLFTQLLGNPDAGGKWTDLSASGKMSVDGILDLNGLSEKTYSFRYTIDVQGCPKSEATVTVAVKIQNDAGTGRDTLLCATQNFNLFNLLKNYSVGGTWTSSNAGSALAGNNFNTIVLPEGNYNFTYTVNSNSPCVNKASTVQISTVKPVDAGNGSILTTCLGDVIELKSKITGSFDQGGTWKSKNPIVGLNTSTGQWNTNGNNAGGYEIWYIVTAKSPCSNDTAKFSIQLKEEPIFINPTYTCINKNRQYEVTLNIEKGNPNTYKVSPLGGTLTPGTPYSYKTPPIKSNQSATYYVDDNFACGPDSITLFYNCGCVTQSGSTQSDTLKICEGNIAKANYNNGFENDDNDTLIFVLHEGNKAGSIINPIAYSSKPEFGFQLPMIFGKVYYISALAASKGSFNGYNPADTCISIAAGTPVIFFQQPALTYSNNSPVCEGSPIQLNINLSKGKAPFSVIYSLNNVSQTRTSTNNNLTLNFSASVGMSLIIKQVTAGICSQSLNDTIKLLVDDSLTVSSPVLTCNNDNNAFSSSFTISGGKPSNYSITGVGGNLAGNKFTSNFSSSPGTYTLTVSDGSTCPPKQFNISYTCPCISNAGTFTNTNPIKLCGADSVKVKHNNNQRLDGNDRLYFIFHTDTIAPFGILKTASTPAFAYDSSLIFGKTYYISAIAGDSLAGMRIKLSDPCFSKSRFIPVQFFPTPTGILSGDTTLCENVALVFPLKLTGIGPYNLTFLDQSNKSYQFNNIAADSIISIKPSAGSYLFRFTRMRDLASMCDGTVSGTLKATIIPAPKGSITGDTSYCDGFALPKLNIKLSGVKPYDVTIALNGKDTLSFTSLDSTFSFNVNPPVGQNYFYISAIQDLSPAGCKGISSDSALVVVNPIPHVTLSGNDSVCLGQQAQLNFTISNIPANYNSTYEIKYSNTSTSQNFTLTTNLKLDSAMLTPILGNNNYQISSVKDLNTGCSGTFTNNATLFAQQLPTAQLRGDSILCDNGQNQVNLYFKITGTAMVKIYYHDNKGNKYVYSNVANTNEYLVNQMLSIGQTSFVIDSVIDGSKLSCAGTFSGVANYTVRALPTASIFANGTKNLNICEGEAVNLEISANGNFPVTVSIVDELGSVENFSITNNQIISKAYFPAPGLHTFSIQQVAHFTAPVCSTTISDLVTINVEALPIAKLTIDNDSVCQGESTKLIFSTISIGEVNIAYSIDGNLQPSFTTVNKMFEINVDLSAGEHLIKIESVKATSALACDGKIDIGNDSIAFVRILPQVLSISAMPNPVCFGSSTTLKVLTNQEGPFLINFSSVDSTWQANLNNGDAITIGPINKDFRITANQIAYIGGSACTQASDAFTDIKVLQLPTAELLKVGGNTCQGQPIDIEIALSGNGLVNGTFRDLQNNTYPFAGYPGTNKIIIIADTNTTYFFTANTIVDEAGCTNTGTGSLSTTVYPIPVVSFTASDEENCLPLLTTLYNTTAAKYEGIACSWNIANGLFTFTSCDSTPAVNITNAGNYDVSLTVTSIHGCVGELTQQALLKAYPIPLADFDYSPKPILISNPVVQFSDKSTLADTWFWDLESLGTRTQQNPTVLFPGEPDFEVKVSLTVTSQFGCTDSTSKALKVLGELLVNIPNTFTPNGDGYNEIFLPILYGVNMERAYELIIFDRWGEIVFSTNDASQGWDGTYQGKQVKSDTYVYKIKAQSLYSTNIKEFKGNINLLR